MTTTTASSDSAEPLRPAVAAETGPEGLSARESLGPLVGYFLKLGTIGFGGPVALVGYMHRDLVERRRWVTEIILTQLTKPRVEAGLAGGDHVPDLHVTVGHDHSVDEQLDQLATPGEGRAIQVPAQARAHVGH